MPPSAIAVPLPSFLRRHHRHYHPSCSSSASSSSSSSSSSEDDDHHHSRIAVSNRNLNFFNHPTTLLCRRSYNKTSITPHSSYSLSFSADVERRGDGDDVEEASVSSYGTGAGEGVYVKVEISGKNRRRIRARIRIPSSLRTVWEVLTDYEGLAGFIPSLASCQLISKSGKFVRIFQVGQQNLALGFKFNAKGTLDCYENEIENFPFGQRRDIDFRMVEGDFEIFEGKWSLVQGPLTRSNTASSDHIADWIFLSYIVDLEPKLWLPVRLLEGRICDEIEMNLVCIREEVLRRINVGI